MAVRIEDKDERISSLAKLFFHELSKKGMETCVKNID
jgi:condensin complex subunit 1